MTEVTRVLLVEDHPEHARLALEYLQSTGGYRVDLAGDIAALWESLTRHAYDVILLDYNLPDGTGLNALRGMPAHNCRLPVIMVTGRGDEQVAVQALHSGAVDYVVKTGDYLRRLPIVIERAVRTGQLLEAARHSLAQVRYQAVLLENVRDAVVAWDLAGRITFWNRAAEVLFERSAEELLGRFQAGWYQQSVRPPVELPSSGMTLLDVERRFRRRSGEEIWLSSGVIALRNETDSLIGYMDVARDITGRKRLEAQVQVAQGQLVQAARLAAIGELASGVAHQISNPLTTVIGEAQLLLQESKVGRPGRESVEAIERAGWRAQQTVQRLLEFSRPAPETLDWVEINETIQQAMDLIGAQLEAAGIVIGLDLAKTLPRVHGQARQLEDLWINLLILARDALVVESGEGRARRVSVCSCLAGKSKVSVAVTDSGSAIPPERLASIFEPDFTGFQGGRAHGLELSICREIVRQHGGEIGVDSSLHHGTTFTVKLPAEVEG